MEFFDLWDAKNRLPEYNCNIFIGVRGVGKTYSALSAIPRGLYPGKLAFSRLTQNELDIVAGVAANSFKTINEDYDESLGFFPMDKGMYGISRGEVEKGKFHPTEQPVGYASSLMTFSTVCGMDFSDVSHWIIDEFIAKPYRERYLPSGRFDMILTVLETINRNREFKGIAPCKLIMLSNSNNIYDEILVDMGLTETLEQMSMGLLPNDHYDDDRSIALHLVETPKEFAVEKQKTAVARLAQGTDYGKMAFENSFSYNDFSGVGKRNLSGYRPLYSVGGRAYVYESGGHIHVSYRRAMVLDYPINYAGKRLLAIDHPELKIAMARGNVTYDSYDLKAKIFSAVQ